MRRSWKSCFRSAKEGSVGEGGFISARTVERRGRARMARRLRERMVEIEIS